MIRHKIVITSLTIALLGVAIVSAPYLSALIKAGDDEATGHTIMFSDLKTGSFVEVELKSSRVFVLRDFDERIFAFSVPFSDMAYWLPEFDWSHPAVPCAQFEPDNKNGMLVEDGKFRCVLPDYGEFFRREHSWSYSGKNQGYRTADMKVAVYEVTGDSVLLFQ